MSARRLIRQRQRGFTLLEMLMVVVVLAVLIAIAVPMYYRSVEQARSVEAVNNLDSIRQAQLLHQAATGAFVDAVDLPTINTVLALDLTARHYEYAIEKTGDSGFMIAATGRQIVPGAGGPLRVTMDETGHITYDWPAGAGGSAGSGGGGGRGSGGVSGGGSGSGSGGSGGGSGGSSPGGGSSPPSSPPSEPPPSPPSPPLEPPLPGGGGGLILRARGTDQWTGWPDTNTRNITGTQGVELLGAAFDLVANSLASSVTNDLFRKGLSIAFGSPADFAGPLASAIAYFSFAGIVTMPATPDPLPFILFNPKFITEDPKVLAAVLVHEGTHFQQFLDGTTVDYLLRNKTVVDVEFTAWWNGAAFWQTVRGNFLPPATTVAFTNEAGYQAALQGEGALRDLITSLYT